MKETGEYLCTVTGEIIFTSSINQVLDKKGNVRLADNEEELLKRYMLLKAEDGFIYKIEALGTKPSRKYWLTALANEKIGTKIRISCICTVRTYEKDDQTLDAFLSYKPIQTQEVIDGKETKYPYKVIKVAQETEEPEIRDPDDDDGLPF